MTPAGPAGGNSFVAAAGHPAQALLVARGLGKSYGPLAVLSGVDLEVASSSLVAVAGRNGAGKSTLLACLAGTVRHEGSVSLGEQPVGRATRGRVAFLPQRLRMPGSATGREIMGLFGAMGGDRPDRAAPPEGFLPDLDKPVGQLSGGQAQRVALAAVLQSQPDLVLLDEPFANLDDDARDQAHALLRAHRDAGASILIASPTALDLLAMIDRVLLVENGGISFDGAPSSYAGRLEMVIWVRASDVPRERLEGLPHVLRVRAEGDWLALSCHDEQAVDLLRELGAMGIGADAVRLGGPAAEERLSSSPGSGLMGVDAARTER